MSNYGVKVSKVGKNVKTAANSDLTYKSSVQSSRIQMVVNNQITIPAGSSSGTVTISHGLGYTPVVYAEVMKSQVLPTPSYGTDYIACHFYANNSSVVIKMRIAGIYITYGASNNFNVCIMKDRLK